MGLEQRCTWIHIPLFRPGYTEWAKPARGQWRVQWGLERRAPPTLPDCTEIIPICASISSNLLLFLFDDFNNTVISYLPTTLNIFPGHWGQFSGIFKSFPGLVAQLWSYSH